MPSESLHSWSLSARAAMRLQADLARRVVIERAPGPLRWVAGLDAAFSPDGCRCLGVAVLWDAAEGRVVRQALAWRQLRFPYIPGLLSFREAPALLAALRRLGARPDVLLCDGQGLAHPRRFGLACHLGLWCDLPAIGCAKSRLIGDYAEPDEARGAASPLCHAGETIGMVLRTQDGTRPVFVSVGHRVTLEQSRDLVLTCCTRYRLPEPTRWADGVSKIERRRSTRRRNAPLTMHRSARRT